MGQRRDELPNYASTQIDEIFFNKPLIITEPLLARNMHHERRQVITKEDDMLNEEMIKGKWKEIKGEIKTLWGKLTDDELDKTSGNLESIAGIIQQRYGNKKEDIVIPV